MSAPAEHVPEVEKSHPRWESIWANGLPPGESFDMASPSPILEKMVREGKVPTGRALVPGCGRGYDVIVMASKDRHVTGLELSTTAVERANEYAVSVGADPSTYSFLPGNFFDIDTSSMSSTSSSSSPSETSVFPPPQGFDMIYDYTFLCALHPTLRLDWANKMKALLKPHGGELWTLIYPICDKVDGPPYAVSMDIVRELCEGAGLRMKELYPLSAELSHPGRDGTKSPTNRWNASCAFGVWVRED